MKITVRAKSLLAMIKEKAGHNSDAEFTLGSGQFR
jgi:hypothetical protein